MKPKIAAYYFPNYHADARNGALHGAGWDEWALMRAAKPRFEGHAQPKIPLWGFEDEADPQVMARKIGAARSHGVDAFLFDWYFFDDGPFLGRALDEGFLGAANGGEIEFALMWANHDWLDLFPAKASDVRGGATPRLLHGGAVNRATWETLVETVISRYFSQPNYLQIEGCPYFSIYELATFVAGLGGPQNAREAMEFFRARVREAGFPDLHLNLVAWGVSPWSFRVLAGESRVENPLEFAQSLGAASVTPYVWVHHYDLGSGGFPRASYEAALRDNLAFWEEAAQWPFAFFPNVTMGWDASPRTVQTDEFRGLGYPFCAVLEATPAQFKSALQTAKSWCQAHPRHGEILTLNAWNEWSEGSYLEPDTVNGYGYLEAIREVFGA